MDASAIAADVSARVARAVPAGSAICVGLSGGLDSTVLLDILAEHTISVPGSLADADWLTPWAVAARYGASDAALDREAAVVVADKAVAWADATIDFGA